MARKTPRHTSTLASTAWRSAGTALQIGLLVQSMQRKLAEPHTSKLPGVGPMGLAIRQLAAPNAIAFAFSVRFDDVAQVSRVTETLTR